MKYGKKTGFGMVKDCIPDLEDLSKRSNENIKGLMIRRLVHNRKKGANIEL